MSNGEETPKGESLRARLWEVNITDGEILPDRLSVAQAAAASGLYAASLSGFVHWIAEKDYDAAREFIRREFPGLRSRFQGARLHARTPGIAANLLLGLHFFTRFGVERGALTEQAATDAMNRCRAALIASMSSQRDGQIAMDPVQQFIDLIHSSLATGKARLDLLDGTPLGPPSAGQSNWYSVSDPPLIGWRHGSDVYLDANQSYAFAQRLAVDQHDPITLTKQTLFTRMREAGFLVTELSQAGNLHRLPAPNRNIRGLRLHPEALNARDSGDNFELLSRPPISR